MQATFCLPLEAQLSDFATRRHVDALGAEGQMTNAPAGKWCTISEGPSQPSRNNTNATAAASTPVPYLAATDSRRGQEGQDGALIPESFRGFFTEGIVRPANVPYYTHPSWPGHGLCDLPAILLQDVGVEHAGAFQPEQDHLSNSSTSSSSISSSSSPPIGNAAEVAGSGMYSGTFTVHYNNSAWLPCDKPVMKCSVGNSSNACLAEAYVALNPDNDPAAIAAAQEAAANHAVAATETGGGSHGVEVVLPAVLGSIGESQGDEYLLTWLPWCSLR